LTLEYPEHAGAFQSVAYGDGLPASAKWVREGILARYAEPAPQAAGPASKRAGAAVRPSSGTKTAATKSASTAKAAKAIRK
jgi:hypothetical protein